MRNERGVALIVTLLAMLLLSAIGAALVLVGSKEKGAALGLRPRARVVSAALLGDEPTIMLTAPAPTSQRALKKAGMVVGDIDLFEINEAFSAVSLAINRELGLDPKKVNVNGGAVALGHPIGVTGARIVTTLLYAMEARDAHRGLAALCIGGGEALALIVER